MQNWSQHVRRYATKTNPTSTRIFKGVAATRKSLRAPELSRLPPVEPKVPRYLSLRRTEPASAGHLVFHTGAPQGVLDPSHPLARANLNQCPFAHSEFWAARIIPNEILAHAEPEKLPPFSPSASSSNIGDKINIEETAKTFSNLRYRNPQDNPRHAYASFLVVGSINSIHKRAFIRRETVKRIREAIRLIVIRGANSPDGAQLTFEEKDAGENVWLVKGWTYVLWPNLKAYQAPWPALILALRNTLSHLKRVAEKSIKHWENKQVPLANGKRNSGTLGNTATVATKSPPLSPSNKPRPPRPRPSAHTKRSYSSQVKDVDITTSIYPPPIPSSNIASTRWSRRDHRADIVLGSHRPLFHVPSLYFSSEDIDAHNSQQEDFIPIPNGKNTPPVFGIDFSSISDSFIDETRSDPSSHDWEYLVSLKEEGKDFEGWVLGPMPPRRDRKSILSDEPPEDDLSIESLLDANTIARFMEPHIPHHAGRGIGIKLRNEWSPSKYSSTSAEARAMKHDQFVRNKLKEAAEERRKKRKALRARWNNIDREWLEDLRQREIQRLEKVHNVTITEDRRGRLRARMNETVEIPWWAPRPGSLGWDDSSRGMGKYLRRENSQEDEE